jgi:hypothetical protein
MAISVHKAQRLIYQRYAMKKGYLIVLLLLAVYLPMHAQVSLHTESFETDGEGSRYTTNTYFEASPNCNFFTRMAASPLDVCFQNNFFTGFQGNFFWGGEDIMRSGNPLPPGSITTQSINIAGHSTLTVSLYLATANNVTPTNTRWETADSLNVQASIDGGPFRTVGRFMGDDGFGGDLIVDDNLNGVAEVSETTVASLNAFTQYTFNIAGTGSTLQIRLDFDMVGGSEEIGADLIEVRGVVAPCTPPTITCPSTQTVILDSNCQGLFADYTSLATVTGSCAPVVTQSPAIGTVQTGGISLSTTLTATNTAQQTSSCTFTVDFLDQINPTIVCPPNMVVGTDPDTCGAIVTYQMPTGADNCAIAQITLSFGLFSGETFLIGTTTTTLIASDHSSNVTPCSFTVTVIDSTPPVAVCQNDTVTLDQQGNATLAPQDIDGGSSDHCGITTLSAVPNTFTTADLGTNTVVLTVSDAAGNTSTCVASVEVLDFVLATPDPVVGDVRFDASPIPAHDRLDVQLACNACSLREDIQLELWNALGQRLRAIPVTATRDLQSLTVDLRDIAPGSYLLRLQYDGKALTRPFVKF